MCKILRSKYQAACIESLPKDTQLNMNSGTVDAVLPEISDVTFNQESIAKTVGELAYGAAAGPNGIPTIVVKSCVKELMIPFYIL